MLNKIKGKHLLIDTNLLIRAMAYLPKGFLHSFFNELEHLNVKSVIEQTTLFEFLRGSRTKDDLDGKERFLNTLLGGEKNRMDLPLTDEVLKNARELAVIYSNKNPNLVKQISLTDCMIAAQLMHYKADSLYLATIDNKDYPLIIFDRIYIHTEDTGGSIINIGIYRFNHDKFKQCKMDFNKS